MITPPLTRLQLAGYLICVPLYVALLLLVAETLLSATTTYLVIKVARDIANKEFLVYDLFYILASQAASYLVGAASWIFSEMAGCRAFGLYMLRFAQDNRHEVKLLNERNTRERVEPFLTGETFYEIFNMMYEVQSQLELFLGLVFTSLILGVQVDKALPIAYFSIFVILASIQWLLYSRPHRCVRGHRCRTSPRIFMTLVFTIFASDAWAWGEEGHSITAEIAQRRLSQDAAQAITQILRGNPGATPYSTPSLASISTWADEVRYDGAKPNGTYNWHFVDIPRQDTHYDPATECPKEKPEQGDCVINELSRLRNELRCTAGDQQLRALKFAVHFVGDIHQPFHTIWENIGGNGITFTTDKLQFKGKTCSADKMLDAARQSPQDVGHDSDSRDGIQLADLRR